MQHQEGRRWHTSAQTRKRIDGQQPHIRTSTNAQQPHTGYDIYHVVRTARTKKAVALKSPKESPFHPPEKRTRENKSACTNLKASPATEQQIPCRSARNETFCKRTNKTGASAKQNKTKNNICYGNTPQERTFKRTNKGSPCPPCTKKSVHKPAETPRNETWRRTNIKGSD